MAYRNRYRFNPRRYRSYGNGSSSHTFGPAQFVVLGAFAFILIVPIQYWGWNLKQTLILLFLTLFAVVIGIAIIGIRQYLRKERQKRAMQLSQIDTMKGIEFEQYVAKLLQFQGFTNVTVTPPSRDMGADVLATIDGERYVIQAKQYNNWKLVGVQAVQQVVGAMKPYKCERSMVITTGYFTWDARRLAKHNNTTLIDRKILREWILQYSQN